MDGFETARIDAYFSHLAAHFGPTSSVKAICVAHMVPNSVCFLPGLSRMIEVAAVLPKPKSVGRPEYLQIKRAFTTHELSREWAGDADAVLSFFSTLGLNGGRVIVADIGGYFAESIDRIAENFSGEILGVMEGTENGARKYENRSTLQTPVVTVARSPLKLPEDFLVASSIVFSVEAILRDVSQILQTRTACVIGYGRVGSSVAEVLRGRGIPTVIHDHDPIAMAEAAAKGFLVFRRLDQALSRSNLIICATGNCALDKFGFAALKSGTVVATVTSADDELDIAALEVGYSRSKVSPHIDRYDEGKARYFWLINEGNAANFVHGAIIGPAIQLIEGEKMAAIKMIADERYKFDFPQEGVQLLEVSREVRNSVAEIWNDHFLQD